MNISSEINYETSNSALIICGFLLIHSKLSNSTNGLKGLLENYYISIRIYVIPTIQITNGECLGCKLIKRTIKIYCQLSCGSKICIHCHICNIKQVQSDFAIKSRHYLAPDQSVVCTLQIENILNVLLNGVLHFVFNTDCFYESNDGFTEILN